MARDDRKEAILDAALHLFARYGFHGTTVPQVAERAGVGAGTIYRYVESKEALVNAVYQREKLALGRTLMSDPPVGAPWRTQFGAFWRRLIDFAKHRPDSFAFLELHHHAAYLDAKSRCVEDDVMAAARAFFEETTRQLVTKPISPDVLIAIVWGAFAGLVKASTFGLTLDEATVAAAENCVWEAIRR